MIYLLGWLLIYILIFIQSTTNYHGRAFVFIVILFFAIVAFIRGDVGTDTANYVLMLQGFQDDYSWDGREPGFVALGWLLGAITPNFAIAVNSLALVFFGLLVWYVFYSDRNERFLLMAYVLPVFAYQYSMNALRIGLASAILLIAVQILRKKGIKQSLIVAMTALSFHYSSAFSLAFLYALQQRTWFRFSSFVYLFIFLLLILAVWLLADFYFLDKLEAYQAMQAPGNISGLSKIIPIVVLMIGLTFCSLQLDIKIKLLFMSFVFTLFAWLLTNYSYAGLRMLDLLSFVIPISVLAAYSKVKIRFDISIKVALIIAGLISAAGVWRGFLLEAGQGKSPFLPYEIFSFGLF